MENLKLITANLFEVGAAIAAAKQNDGVIDFNDIGIIGTPALAFMTSLTNLEKVEEEWENASQGQKDELRDYIKERFELADKKLERVIEDALDVAFSLLAFYESTMAISESA